MFCPLPAATALRDCLKKGRLQNGCLPEGSGDDPIFFFFDRLFIYYLSEIEAVGDPELRPPGLRQVVFGANPVSKSIGGLQRHCRGIAVATIVGFASRIDATKLQDHKCCDTGWAVAAGK